MTIDGNTTSPYFAGIIAIVAGQNGRESYQDFMGISPPVTLKPQRRMQWFVIHAAIADVIPKTQYQDAASTQRVAGTFDPTVSTPG